MQRLFFSIKDAGAQLSLAKKVVGEQLSVRALEEIVSKAVVLDGGKTLKNKIEESTNQPEFAGGMLRPSISFVVLSAQSGN